MPDNTKLYDALGVSRDASPDEIKKAYRKSAIRHHPDKGGDTEKFQEITHAFQVLSDDSKRQIYDTYGEEGLKEGGPGGPGGFEGADLFDAMFGGGLFGGMGGGGRGRSGPKKVPDGVHQLTVKLADVYNGKTSRIAVSRKRLCKKCGGTGATAKNKVKTCSGCHGQGIRIVRRMIGPGMVQQMQEECPECDGRGTVVPAAFRCPSCRGNMVGVEKKTLEVYIEKGMRDGSKIVFSGESDEAPGYVAGDIVVVLRVAEHDDFSRKAQHLILEKDINLAQSLCGVEFTVRHLDGRTLVVRSRPGEVIKPGTIKSIMGEGMPIHKRPDEKGFLFVKFNVEFPDTLPPDTVAHLDRLLGPRPTPVLPDHDEDIEEVEMIEFQDYHAREATGNGRTAYDEDEEGGAQRVQCAQQ